jgi:hypothetical protein
VLIPDGPSPTQDEADVDAMTKDVLEEVKKEKAMKVTKATGKATQGKRKAALTLEEELDLEEANTSTGESQLEEFDSPIVPKKASKRELLDSILILIDNIHLTESKLDAKLDSLEIFFQVPFNDTTVKEMMLLTTTTWDTALRLIAQRMIRDPTTLSLGYYNPFTKPLSKLPVALESTQDWARLIKHVKEYAVKQKTKYVQCPNIRLADLGAKRSDPKVSPSVSSFPYLTIYIDWLVEGEGQSHRERFG